MHKKENYIYVGVDLHKATHTAVIINCWNEKLGELTIENKPSEFNKLFKLVDRLAGDLKPAYGLENAYGYGRSLAVYLLEKGEMVKDINPALSFAQRKSAVTTKKSDSYDAQCVADVLVSRLDELPDANPEDNHWTLKNLVTRRDNLVKDGIRLKNQLYEQLVTVYPSYKRFFTVIDRRTALYFWKTYPSPMQLKGKTVDELAEELRAMSNNQCSTNRAALILTCVEADGDTHREFQGTRDFITQSIVRDLEHQQSELGLIEDEIEKMVSTFGYKLESIPGVSTITAASLISEIGDIDRFDNANKLAKFAGIAPVNFSSAGKGKDQASKQGNRELNGIFYFMAVQMVQTARGSGIPRQPVFYEYFQRKISEGKNKTQALVCIMRRLVNIIYGMMKNKTEYRMPTVD